MGVIMWTDDITAIFILITAAGVGGGSGRF